MSILKKVVASLTGENVEEKEPVQFFRRNGIYFKLLPSKGRGVFCKDDIKAGELIEVAPLLILNESDTRLANQMRLRDYVFSTKSIQMPQADLEQQQIQDPSQASCFLMGVVSFCNHLVDENAHVEWIADEFVSYVVLKAKKDIPAGEEICVNYGIAWLTLHKKGR